MRQIWLVGLLGFGLIGCGNQATLLTTEVDMSETSEEISSSEPTITPSPPEPAADEITMPKPTPSELPPSSTAVAPTSAPSEPTLPPLPGIELFAFAPGEPGWYTVDDDVMGGVSSSTVAVTDAGTLAFSGNMSLENNGGFSSVRSDWTPMDLSSADGILLRVLGDGKTYRLRIRTADAGPEISYNASFATTADSWQTVYVPFAGMVPTYRGFVMDVGALNPATVGSFGLMLSDKQPGEFSLWVDWMRAVSEADLQALNDGLAE